MEIVQIAGIGLLAAILILVLKEQKPLFAFLLAVFTGMFIFLMMLGHIDAVIGTMEGLAERSGIPSVYLKTILKMIGIAYIAELASQIIRDAGADSVASKVEFAGKVLILVMAVPIINVIVETVVGLLPAGGEAHAAVESMVWPRRDRCWCWTAGCLERLLPPLPPQRPRDGARP